MKIQTGWKKIKRFQDSLAVCPCRNTAPRVYLGGERDPHNDFIAHRGIPDGNTAGGRPTGRRTRR